MVPAGANLDRAKKSSYEDSLLWCNVKFVGLHSRSQVSWFDRIWVSSNYVCRSWFLVVQDFLRRSNPLSHTVGLKLSWGDTSPIPDIRRHQSPNCSQEGMAFEIWTYNRRCLCVKVRSECWCIFANLSAIFLLRCDGSMSKTNASHRRCLFNVSQITLTLFRIF